MKLCFSPTSPYVRKVLACAITREIERFQSASHAAGAFAESFMTAPSPGIISTTMLNAYYDSQQSYLTALAREMRNEYLAIHRSGLLLQIDAPDLAMDRSMFYRDLADREFVKAAEMHVAALNQAIDGIPRDRVRLVGGGPRRDSRACGRLAGFSDYCWFLSG